MATLALSAIPSHVNTYERLLVWAAMAIQSSCNGLTAAVIPNQGATPVCQVQLGVGADGVERFVVAAYVPLDNAALAAGTDKVWMAAKDLTASAPNSNYLAN
jgi:hypothetical protein